jgi:hypothetical protein
VEGSPPFCCRDRTPDAALTSGSWQDSPTLTSPHGPLKDMPPANDSSVFTRTRTTSKNLTIRLFTFTPTSDSDTSAESVSVKVFATLFVSVKRLLQLGDEGLSLFGELAVRCETKVFLVFDQSVRW